MQAHPEALFFFNPKEVRNNTFLAGKNYSSRLAFVETSTSPRVAKERCGDDALLWTHHHRKVFRELFENQRHTAVDYVALPDASGQDHHFIVTIKNFDENNPNCLKESL